MIILYLRCKIIKPYFLMERDNKIINRSMSCPPKEDSETDALFNQQLLPASDLQGVIKPTPTLSDLMWLEQMDQQQCQKYPKERKQKWPSKETQDFYKLLQCLGPDFSSMQTHQLFAETNSEKNKEQIATKQPQFQILFLIDLQFLSSINEKKENKNEKHL